jgi:hypothetical protein
MKTISMMMPDILNPARRSFIKTTAAGAALAGAGGLLEIATQDKSAQAFAYEPYLTGTTSSPRW